MENTYHATPYDLSAPGFYFEDYEDYQSKAAKHRNAHGQPVEEYEIQFIDGDNPRLFDVLGINQANLKQWFDDYETLDGEDRIKAIYLADDLGVRLDELLSRIEDVILFEGTATEYAHEYIEDTGLLGDMPENLQFYFDTEAFARDMVLGGDITEITVDGTDYIAWGC